MLTIIYGTGRRYRFRGIQQNMANGGGGVIGRGNNQVAI